MESLQKIDLKTFEYINSLAGNIKIIDEIILMFANDYFVPVSIGLIFLFHWISFSNTDFKIQSQKSVLKSIIIMVISNIIIMALNQIIFRERPFEVNDINLLFYMPTDSSFPSNACAGSISLALGFLSKKWIRTFFIILLLAILMSLSRIYVGIHYPSDIAAGVLVAIGSYFIGHYIWKYSTKIQLKCINALEYINMA